MLKIVIPQLFGMIPEFRYNPLFGYMGMRWVITIKMGLFTKPHFQFSIGISFF